MVFNNRMLSKSNSVFRFTINKTGHKIMHEINSIGTIHSPYYSIEDMPIQPKGASEVEGSVIVDEK